MKLSEFIATKNKELGLKWADYQAAGIGAQTYYNIMHDKQRSMQPATMEKLALVLKCCKGDIQASIADTPNPLRKEAEKREGVIGKKSAKKEMPAPDPVDEEPAEVFQPEPEPEMDFPEYHSPYQEERDAGAEEYKAKLREMVLKIMAEGIPGQDTLSDVYADVGIALVKELIGEQK